MGRVKRRGWNLKEGENLREGRSDGGGGRRWTVRMRGWNSNVEGSKREPLEVFLFFNAKF